jgi:hypothetical protein
LAEDGEAVVAAGAVVEIVAEEEDLVALEVDLLAVAVPAVAGNAIS